MPNPSLQKIAAEKKAALDAAEAAALDGRYPDLVQVVDRHSALAALLEARTSETTKRGRTVAAIVVLLACAATLIALVSIRIPSSRVTVNALAQAVTLELGGDFLTEQHVTLDRKQPVWIRNIQKLELTIGGKPLRHETTGTDTISIKIEAAGIELAKLNLKKNVRFQISAVKKGCLALHARGGPASGQLLLTGDVQATVYGAKGRFLEKASGSIEVPEALSFETRTSEAGLRIEGCPIEEHSLRILGVRSLWFLSDLPETTTDVFVTSSLKSGKILVEPTAALYELLNVHELRIADVEAGGAALAQTKDGISVAFRGIAKVVQLGEAGGRARDLSPTILEYLKENRLIVVLLFGFSFLWGLVWATLELLGYRRRA